MPCISVARPVSYRRAVRPPRAARRGCAASPRPPRCRSAAVERPRVRDLARGCRSITAAPRQRRHLHAARPWPCRTPTRSGVTPELLLRAAGREPEAGDDLVEDQQRRRARRRVAVPPRDSRGRGDAPVLQSTGSAMTAAISPACRASGPVSASRSFHGQTTRSSALPGCCPRVPGTAHGASGGPGRVERRVHAVEHRVEPAVVVALELEDLRRGRCSRAPAATRRAPPPSRRVLNRTRSARGHHGRRSVSATRPRLVLGRVDHAAGGLRPATAATTAGRAVAEHAPAPGRGRSRRRRCRPRPRAARPRARST